MANRKVKITYTQESGRPPFYTTEGNIPEQDKLFRSIIKEIELVEPDKEQVKVMTVLPPKDNTLIPLPIQKEPSFVSSIMSDKQLIDALLLKGKTEEEITEFLKPKEYVLKPFKETKVDKRKKSAKFQ